MVGGRRRHGRELLGNGYRGDTAKRAGNNIARARGAAELLGFRNSGNL